MIGHLPESLTVCGRDIPINADFRNVLTIFEAFADPELTEHEKAYVCIHRLYREPIKANIAEEAIKQAFWFVDGGDMPKSKPEQVRTIDWKHDEQMILPAVSKTMGVVDIRSLPYLHWWTFLAAYQEIGDCLFAQVVSIRKKRATGKKLDKQDQAFYRENADLVDLRIEETDAEKEILDAWM
jgi:hypothetical protein